MKVSELIVELIKMPQGAEVAFNVHDDDSQYAVQDDTSRYGGVTIYGQ